MSLHIHHLTGCAPAPLAFYLKGLAVLRLVGEQKDPSARGWWEDERFCLMTQLDRDELERFFLDEYAPTPMVSPWNKGSGFYDKADEALRTIESSTAKRFEKFRRGIEAGRSPLVALREADAAVRAIKDRTKKRKGMSAEATRSARALRDDPEYKRELASSERRFKELKADLIGPLHRTWRGAHREWMDVALVRVEDGRIDWPALLGTGGNDGNFDFTNNAMQRIVDLFDVESREGQARDVASEALRNALWAWASNKTGGGSIGQFFPGVAGGANSGNGFFGGTLVNPWDFLLMLEGTFLFAARSTKHLDTAAPSQASAPFAVQSHGAGHATPGKDEERGEQWMPLWSRPTGLLGLRALISESRLQIGRVQAARPIDAARAIARLGVDRGLSGFIRFGYLERNGQSKIAVPLSRIDVRARVGGRLIDDIAPWVSRLQRRARGDRGTIRFVNAERALADSVLAVLCRDETPASWQAVLLAAVEIEEVQASGAGFEDGPVPPLAPEWVAACDDGTPEWRLARALGSAASSYRRDGSAVDPVRHHWLPLERRARRFKKEERRLRRDPRVVVTGRDPVGDLAALVERRLIEAASDGARTLPLVAARGCGAHPADLALVLSGDVDLHRVSALARAFMAVRWERWSPVREAIPKGDWPSEGWMAVRLAHLPWSTNDGRSISVDESIVRRLRSGDVASATETALRRIRSAGLSAPLTAACAPPDVARLWAAALAFPIDRGCAAAMVAHFEPRKDAR